MSVRNFMAIHLRVAYIFQPGPRHRRPQSRAARTAEESVKGWIHFISLQSWVDFIAVLKPARPLHWSLLSGRSTGGIWVKRATRRVGGTQLRVTLRSRGAAEERQRSDRGATEATAGTRENTLLLWQKKKAKRNSGLPSCTAKGGNERQAWKDL